MMFPSLVRNEFCKTPVEVTIYGEGVTEDGAPTVVFNGSLFCNVQSKAKTVYTKEQKLVQVSAVLLFNGDIVPDTGEISAGFVELNGTKRNIVQGVKYRNPDGTVNYTELDVI